MVLMRCATAALFCILATPALGHKASSGWSYPKDCCGNSHCRPVSCSTIVEHSDGSASWVGLYFPQENVKMSGDAMCHVCVAYPAHTRNERVGYCIFLSPAM